MEGHTVTDLLDLGKRLDRAAYDVAKSLVKLDEVQRHAEMSLTSAKAETQTHLTNLRIVQGQIERRGVTGQPKHRNAPTGIVVAI